MKLTGTLYTVGEMQISMAIMESSMEISQKDKNRTSIWSKDILLVIYPKEYKSGYNTDTCMLMFVIHKAKLWKQSRCPTTDI
jgi:hypothetical protein